MKKVAILAGGTSSEREVSLMSANQIYANLDKAKFDARLIEIPKDNSTDWIRQLMDGAFDIVLSGLHGGLGENGAIQGLLECLNIPYVGSGVMSSAICMDKAMSKLIMKARCIPVVDDVFMRIGDELYMFEERIKALGYPLVVKPNKGGSSIGISIVHDKDELQKAFEQVKSFKDDVLIEKYIKGKEVTCGVVETGKGLEVLAVLDIDSDNVFYDYDAKYIDDGTKIEFSALPPFQQDMIQEIAKKVFTALECAGYGRVDMIVKDEQVYVLEMNTLPGLTSHSLVPKAAGQTMSFASFLEKLLYFAV